MPKGRYTDPEFLQLEIERIFSRTWLNACRFDEVERVGDYVDFEIGDQSIVVVRTEQGLRAYFNACRHRGTRLVQGQGRIGEFRCPFHAWRWNLDGSLKYMADEENFDPRPAGELCLPEVKVDTWGGWVFVNMDPDAEPLLDYLDPMPTRLDGYKLEDMRIAWYKSVIVNANWKTGLDAFVESWHVPGTHPQLLRADKHTSPPTIAECDNYGGRTFNELFRYHSRHADIFRYGSEGNSTRLRPEYGVNPEAVYDNVVYNLRELRSLYLPTDLGAAAELRTIPEAHGPEGNAIYQDCARSMPGPPGSTIPSCLKRSSRGACTTGTCSRTRCFSSTSERPCATGPGRMPTIPTRASSMCRACGFRPTRASRQPRRSNSTTGGWLRWAPFSNRISPTCPRSPWDCIRGASTGTTSIGPRR